MERKEGGPGGSDVFSLRGKVGRLSEEMAAPGWRRKNLLGPEAPHSFWHSSGPWLWEAGSKPDGCPMGKEMFTPGTNLWLSRAVPRNPPQAQGSSDKLEAG